MMPSAFSSSIRCCCRLTSLLACLISLPALACHDCINGCYVSREAPQDIKMIMPDVVVHPGSSPGTLLAQGRFQIERDNGLVCRGSNTMTGQLPNSKISKLGGNIYETNVPGIGIRLYREGEQYIRTFYPHIIEGKQSKRRSSGHSYLEGGSFYVELIRLPGPVGAGPLMPGLYSTYWGNGSGPGRPILTSHVIGNSIKIVNSTCEIDAGSRNIPINMGEVQKYQFQGVGSTLNEHGFNIILHCVGGNESQWSKRTGEVGLSFSYEQDTSNIKGVIKNMASTDAADGVGIQLLEARGTPVPTNGVIQAGRLNQSAESTFEVGMSSRYYQTKMHVSGGNVNSQATFTVVYQ